MAIRLRRPTSADLRPLLAAGRGAELTYSPVGISAAPPPPAGYRRDRWERPLGNGSAVFEGARRALRDWEIHRGAGLVVCPAGPPTVDDVVAMSAPLPVGYIDVVCRVVTVVDEADRYHFAYGTLPVHAARGEESFSVRRSGDGDVTFEIVAVSRPHHPLTRVVPPLTTRLQRAATVRYLDAMTAAVS